MSTEAIARVVADIRGLRFLHPDAPPATPSASPEERDLVKGYWDTLAEIARLSDVVDATPMYRLLGTRWSEPYKDFLGLPPWLNSIVCYENEHGNVHVLLSITREKVDTDRWDTENPVRWGDVAWVHRVHGFVGGRGKTGPVETVGPAVLWSVAAYGDGELADVHWTLLRKDFSENAMTVFANSIWVYLQTVTMANCVNVVIAEPTRHRPRPERRRLARLGVQVKEIHIKPVSKSYRGNGQSLNEMPVGVAAHHVRGHYAEYGAHGKGLLFGKLAGRYWIRPHARGSEEHGEIEHIYIPDVANDVNPL